MENDRTSIAYLGLGGNLGDRAATLRTAIFRLARVPGVVFSQERDAASLYESAPEGGPPDQGDYLNTVVRVRTALSPPSLLEATTIIERLLGRTRGVRNAPRTIDVDLLLFDDRVLSERELTVPHPRLAERRFVLDPLCELAPDLAHPLLHCPLRELRRRLVAGSPGEKIHRIAGPEWVKEDVPMVLTG